MNDLRTSEHHPRRFAVLILLICLGPWASLTPGARQKLPETADPSVSPEVAERLDGGLAEAERLRAAWQLDAARERYEAIAADARQANARRHLAAALWGRGRVQGSQSDRAGAKVSHEEALAIYIELNDTAGEAMASRYLGLTLRHLADYAGARKALDRAVELYRELNDVQGLATAYNNLVYLVERSPEKDILRGHALRYAREANDKHSECGVLHEWGDELFEYGDFIQSKEKLNAARVCFESAGDLSDAGRVLTSLGRLQRAHGQLPSAMEHYQRALEMQLRYHAAGEFGTRGPDPLGIIQSYNAIAVTYGFMGRHDEALEHYEKALAGARALKSEVTINFLTGQLGGYYLGLGQYAKAVELLEPALNQVQRDAIVAVRIRQLAAAYAGLGDLKRALDLAERGVAEVQGRGVEHTLGSLSVRADVHRKRGDFGAAERDLRAGIAIIEDMRAKTIPMDFMKRGFTDLHQNLFAEQIELLSQQGRWQVALETAEQARARAFLDLLASRDGAQARNTAPMTPAPSIAAAPAGADAFAGAGASAGASPAAGASAAAAVGQIARLQPPPISDPLAPLNAHVASDAAASSTGVAFTFRGGASEPPVGPAWRNFRPQPAAGQNLESARSAQPATIAEMIATARRLQSTLVAYWVAPTGTFAWVVSPRGAVDATRIDVPAMKLETLVAQASEAVTGTAAFGGLAIGASSQTRPWRELYGLLIRPIRRFLPTADNSLLTIVPHGALFRVSFAALQDEKGQYLIERYRVHYTPAVGVLQFTAREQAPAPRQALLVGDPGALQSASGETMPALPWARKEVAEIAASLPPGTPHVLVDADANEASVREKLEAMDLIHFATHGVIQQQRALASYLALRGGSGAGTAVNAGNDGRLTAEEVYNLHLRARLVVLSACSTALGPMTGDGVIGFTRAFLYAGASSVIATGWDVPDEAGYELMRRFYTHRTAVRGAESLALRTAQLGVIRALRKGALKVTTPSGDVALPEHPLFWAGFVLVGEP